MLLAFIFGFTFICRIARVYTPVCKGLSTFILFHPQVLIKSVLCSQTWLYITLIYSIYFMGWLFFQSYSLFHLGAYHQLIYGEREEEREREREREKEREKHNAPIALIQTNPCKTLLNQLERS